MTNGIGQLSTQASVRRFQMDDVTFTYIVDGAMWIDPITFFPSVPDEFWSGRPNALHHPQPIAMSAGGLLVERDRHKLLIDAGLGEVTGAIPFGHADCGEFLNVFGALDVPVDAIDVFALTHAHVDHTGWAFVNANDGARRAAFPRASYVMAKAEWASLARKDRRPGMADTEGVVMPLRRHPDLSLIEDGDEVAPGVIAVVTPGHSPGHTSYIVTSKAGRRLVAFGDVFHIPAQLHQLDWRSAPDTDASAVPVARARILSQLLQPHTVGFATHFGDQPFGRATYVNNEVSWQPIPTSSLAPAPRPTQ